MNRSNLRTNSFTIARQLLSSSITAYYVPSITDVVWFCYYSIYRPLLTLSTIIYYSVDSNLSFQFVVKHCSGSYPIFLNVLSLTVFIDLDISFSPELNCGKPQRSVLGPVLYLLYTSPVADILRHHNMAFHLYADDTQLYACMLFFLISNISNIKKCLNDKPSWMTANKLKQAKLIYFHSKYSPQKSIITLHFGADLIQPSQLVRDIGANLTVLFL